MKYTITLLVGLPGSGKSHYIANSSTPYTHIIDDPRSKSELPEKLEGDMIIADCHLCREKTRETLNNIIAEMYPDASTHYVFFENNPKQCLKNVAYRNDGRVVEPTINNYSRVYNIPEGSEVVAVFDTSTLKNKRKQKI